MEKKVNLLAGVLTMVVLAISVSLVVLIVTGDALTAGNLAATALCAFVINLVASLIIPMDRVNAAICGWMKMKPGLGHHLFTTLMKTIVYLSIVSLGMTAVKLGFTSGLLSSWIRIYPIMFVAGYLVAALLGPLVFKLSKRLLGAQH